MSGLFSALRSMGAMGVVISLALNMLVNSCILWFTVNHLIGGRAKSTFWRCTFCVFLLWCAAVIAIIVGSFVPFYGFLVVLFVWYKLSIVAIESALELPEGAFTVLVVYILSFAALAYFAGKFMA